jgi:putative ABC transport system permease protein
VLILDGWQEVLETVRRHRLRTFLTGLSVAWGIFMLVLLLGAGNGLRNGVTHRFRSDAINTIWISDGKTSLPFRGLRPNRQVKFTNADYEAIRKHVRGVAEISGRFNISGNFSVSYRDRSSAFDVRAVHPGHRFIEKTDMLQGRFINQIDLAERRKVAVLGDKVVAVLFRGKSPIGERIKIRRIPFEVVGVFNDSDGDRERRRIYIPVTTAQAAYNGRDRLHHLMFTVAATDVAASKTIEEEAHRMLAARHRVDPRDPRAVRAYNGMENYANIMRVFDMIAVFVTLVGIGTILAGVVGVSNIMLISVKERTREFGVRKAVGATPWSIISMVLTETVFLTAVAGYLGLVAGVGLLELASRLIPDNDFIRHPEINFTIALGATLLLVVSGTLAGFFPARRAGRVSVMMALRDE